MKAVAADLRGRQNMAQIYALRAFCGVLIAARVLPQDPPSRHSGRVPTDHILPYPPLNLSEPGGGGHRCSLGEKWKAAMTLLSDVAQEHTLDKRYNLTRFQEALYHLGRVFAAAPKEVSHLPNGSTDLARRPWPSRRAIRSRSSDTVKWPAGACISA
jgi:hypothetical protein